MVIVYKYKKTLRFVILECIRIRQGRSKSMSEMVHENVFEAINEAVKKFMELYRQGDAAAVAGLYSEDAVLMPPGAGFIRGKEGIQAVFESFLAMGIKAMIFEVIEVDPCADKAIEMSTYKLLGPEDQELDHGKYIVVWKREHGEWKMHRDIFNTSVPAPQ